MDKHDLKTIFILDFPRAKSTVERGKFNMKVNIKVSYYCYLTFMILFITCTFLVGCSADDPVAPKSNQKLSLFFLTGPFEGEEITLHEGDSNIGRDLNIEDISSEDEELLIALETLDINMEDIYGDYKITLTPGQNDNYELFVNDEAVNSSIELQEGDLLDFFEKSDSSLLKTRSRTNLPTTIAFSSLNQKLSLFFLTRNMSMKMRHTIQEIKL